MERDTYYTEACICGAQPAYHIGHTTQCVNETGHDQWMARAQEAGIVSTQGNGRFTPEYLASL